MSKFQCLPSSVMTSTVFQGVVVDAWTLGKSELKFQNRFWLLGTPGIAIPNAVEIKQTRKFLVVQFSVQPAVKIF